MAIGEVRVNPQTGETIELQQVGNNKQWVEIEDDKAALAQQAAQVGPAGAFIASAVDTAAFGAADQPMLEAQRRQSPNAALAGDVTALVAPMLPGLSQLRAGSRAVQAATASERVTAGIEAGLAKKASEKLIRRPSNILGGQGTTLGGAARIIEAGVDSIPGLNLVGLGQRAFNKRVYNEGLARAFNVSDDIAKQARGGITPPVRKAINDEFRKDFARTEAAIGNNVDQLAANTTLAQAKELGLVNSKLAKALEQGEINGKELMALRSDLGKVTRGSDPVMVKNQASALIDEIDDQISAALQDSAEEIAHYSQTRARWKLFEQVKVGRGIGADGTVNPLSMDARLRGKKAFGETYASGDELTGATKEVNDFLELMRAGATLETGLQSSGTAERLIGVGAVTGAGAALLSN